MNARFRCVIIAKSSVFATPSQSRFLYTPRYPTRYGCGFGGPFGIWQGHIVLFWFCACGIAADSAAAMKRTATRSLLACMRGIMLRAPRAARGDERGRGQDVF